MVQYSKTSFPERTNSEPYLGTRHNSGPNILWADGHAAWAEWEKLNGGKRWVVQPKYWQP